MTNYWIDTTTDTPVTEADIRSAHPLTVFPVNPFRPQPELYAPLQAAAVPEYDSTTHRAELLAPERDGQQWRQQWAVVPLTQQELDAARRALVPPQVSRAQGKVALIQAGLWPQVLAFVAAIPDPVERAVAEVALHDTQEWRRDSAFLAQAAQALDLTEQQLDELFVTAAEVAL